MIEKIATLKSENQSLDKKVQGFKSGGVKLISDEEINATANERLFYAQQWRKHKKECKNIIDIISETSDLNTKQFIKKIGVETDEEFNVSLDTYIK
jgi:hypothetical protein